MTTPSYRSEWDCRFCGSPKWTDDHAVWCLPVRWRLWVSKTFARVCFYNFRDQRLYWQIGRRYR